MARPEEGAGDVTPPRITYRKPAKKMEPRAGRKPKRG